MREAGTYAANVVRMLGGLASPQVLVLIAEQHDVLAQFCEAAAAYDRAAGFAKAAAAIREHVMICAAKAGSGRERGA